jgi:putative flippase GtrA
VHYLRSLKQNKNLEQVLKFIVVGVFGNILNYLVFLFFFKIIEINYLIAGVIGFVSPLPILFFLNRNWTFQSNVKTSRMSLYFLTNFLGLGVHSSTQFIVFEFLGVPKVFSQLLGQISSATMNFLLSKFYIFKEK